MPRIDASESKILLAIIGGAFLVGMGLSILGLYLVRPGGNGEAEIVLWGQRLNSKNAGVTSIFIGAMLIVSLVRPAYKVLNRPQMHHDSLITLLQTFQRGTGNPTENVSLLERIANSNNPNKRDYLMQAAQTATISFMEVDAINLALIDLEKGVLVTDLLRRCREKELPKIQAMVPNTSDPLYKPIVTTFKYDRYVARKDSLSYAKINEFLGESLAHSSFTPRALQLSRELEAELRGTMPGTTSAVHSSSQTASATESNRDKFIRLAARDMFSEGMDAANAALVESPELVSDVKFACALARSSAALGDIKTSLMALQVLCGKNAAALQDPELASTVAFLSRYGLTAEMLGDAAG